MTKLQDLPVRRDRHAAPTHSPLNEARARLQRDVKALATGIGERNMAHREALNAAAAFVESGFGQAGLSVERQGYAAGGGLAANLVAEIRGRALPEELIVVGAHYDSPAGSEGANANASGVAALLELARRLSARPMARTLRFVAFGTTARGLRELAGSKIYAHRCRERGECIQAMLSLEALGHFSLAPAAAAVAAELAAAAIPEGGASLHALVRPQDRSGACAVGNLSSRGLLASAQAAFACGTRMPLRARTRPGLLPYGACGDHTAFWGEGYRALLVTGARDAWEDAGSLDYGAMAAAVAGIEGVVEDFAGRLLFDGD